MAGREQKSQQQADSERDRRHDFEIDQRLEADPADFFQIAGAGDAVHDDAEYDRRDDHLNELEERVTEDFQRNGEIRRRHAEDDAENQRRRRPGRTASCKAECGRLSGGAATAVVDIWRSPSGALPDF